MENCCHQKQQELETTARRHRHLLWIVLTINLVMFFVELSFGIISDSLALVGDSLDMLGDAITYGSSLLVVGLRTSEKAKVAKLKAYIMLIFGLAISAKCFYRAAFPVIPEFSIMLIIGIIALLANVACLGFLTRHKDDDINMRSVWICSRNDIVANSSVLLAAGAVFLSQSAIPDMIVGVSLTILFTRSALGILKEVNAAMERVNPPT